MIIIYKKNNSLARSESEFKEFYDSELKNTVKDLNEERKVIANKIKKTLPIFIVVGLLILFFQPFSDAIYFVIVGYMFSVSVYSFVYSKKQHALNQKMKEEIISKTVKFVSPTFNYYANDYIPIDDFVDSEIFRYEPDDFEGDDLITGQIGDGDTFTQFYFSEVTAFQSKTSQDSKGNQRKKKALIFKGLFYVVDFNKDFQGVTLITPKKSSIGVFDKIASSYSFGYFNGMDEVHLEDSEFSNTFNVRSTDEFKARYILTPTFMKRLLSFSSSQSAKRNLIDKPYFSFKNGRMYFLLETNYNHFHLGLFSELNYEVIKSYFSDLNRAFELVDELNLNLRVWNKK